MPSNLLYQHVENILGNVLNVIFHRHRHNHNFHRFYECIMHSKAENNFAEREKYCCGSQRNVWETDSEILTVCM